MFALFFAVEEETLKVEAHRRQVTVARSESNDLAAAAARMLSSLVARGMVAAVGRVQPMDVIYIILLLSIFGCCEKSPSIVCESCRAANILNVPMNREAAETTSSELMTITIFMGHFRKGAFTAFKLGGWVAGRRSF